MSGPDSVVSLQRLAAYIVLTDALEVLHFLEAVNTEERRGIVDETTKDAMRRVVTYLHTFRALLPAPPLT
jgi:hypothetical protein